MVAKQSLPSYNIRLILNYNLSHSFQTMVYSSTYHRLRDRSMNKILSSSEVINCFISLKSVGFQIIWILSRGKQHC